MIYNGNLFTLKNNWRKYIQKNISSYNNIGYWILSCRKKFPLKEKIVRLKLIDNRNLAYAYDIKLKKVVFINPYNKFKIMLIAN